MVSTVDPQPRVVELGVPPVAQTRLVDADRAFAVRSKSGAIVGHLRYAEPHPVKRSDHAVGVSIPLDPQLGSVSLDLIGTKVPTAAWRSEPIAALHQRFLEQTQGLDKACAEVLEQATALAPKQ